MLDLDGGALEGRDRRGKYEVDQNCGTFKMNRGGVGEGKKEIRGRAP